MNAIVDLSFMCENCYSLHTSSQLVVSRETTPIHGLRGIGLSYWQEPAIFYHIHQGTYGMPGEPPGIYLLDAYRDADGGRADHCLWSGSPNATANIFAWTNCNNGADCEPVGTAACSEWAFDAIQVPSASGRFYRLIRSGCTNVTDCRYAGTRSIPHSMGTMMVPLMLVGVDDALVFESVCVPCPGAALGTTGVLLLVMLVVVAMLPTLYFMYNARSASLHSSSAWPAAPRSTLAVATFQVGWMLVMLGITPTILWNLGRWWGLTASFNDLNGLVPLGMALMALMVRSDDSVLVMRAVSTLVLVFMFFHGIAYAITAAGWWSSWRADEVGGHDYQLPAFTRGFLYTWQAVFVLLLAVALLVALLRTHGVVLNRPQESESVLRQLWRAYRLTGFIYLVVNVTGYLISFVLLQTFDDGWDSVNTTNHLYFTLRGARIWSMLALLFSVLITSPRLRLRLHTLAGWQMAPSIQFAAVNSHDTGTRVTLPSNGSGAGASGSSHKLFAARPESSWRGVDLSAWEQSTVTDLGTIQLERLVGEGHYSNVYIGRSPTAEREFAVKVFRRSAYSDAQSISYLTSEIELALTLEHPNLVQTYGRVMVAEAQPAMVMELMVGGTLAAFLHPRGSSAVHQEPQLTPGLQHRIAHDVASGLGYLHSNRISHRDVKPCNVLLDGHINAKLCDFGVSTRFGMERSAVGTLRYMAPEVVFGEYTYKADVYSYGVLLWEVLHRAIPFGKQSGIEVMFKVHNASRPSIGPLPPELSTHGTLVSACWEQAPVERPDFAEITRRLEAAAPPLVPEAGTTPISPYVWLSRQEEEARSHDDSSMAVDTDHFTAKL